MLTFYFETGRYQHDTSDLAAWFNTAGSLLTGVLAVLHAPVDIKRGLVYLESYILRDKKNQYRNLQLGEAIKFDRNTGKSSVTVEKIEKIDGKKNMDLQFPFPSESLQ